ncbi:DUF1735 domain-containing protein [Mucilaginibacter terrigena]|uniref:DUF1735 domain-containing protein n=1 Tax=Mucilaginibacter terrigena TaxID=2492395 RepID=A0A4Q5LL60_9SPHI|nr:DUF1735 domain-containing protein [Mucilaginibacter terrigena]
MKKYLKIASVLALVTGLSSCLKDEPIIGGKPQNIVEFYTTDAYTSGTTDLYPAYTKGFTYSTSDKFDVTVSYSGTDVAPEDITVNLGVNGDAVPRTNAKTIADARADAIANGEDPDDAEADVQGDLLTNAPTASYQIPANVVIKKGTRRAVVSITVNPSLFDFDHNYVIPLTITSASMGTVSGNFGTVIYGVKYKNQYDGVYHSSGQFVHPTAGPRDLNADKSLLTTGPNSNLSSIGDVGGSLIITVNPTTNLVTFDGALSASQPIVPVPGQDNYYDPATKTYHLNYQYTGGGGFRVIHETLTLKP